MCLSLCGFHTVSVIVLLQVLKSGNMNFWSLCFSSIFFAIWDPLRFHINFKMGFFHSWLFFSFFFTFGAFSVHPHSHSGSHPWCIIIIAFLQTFSTPWLLPLFFTPNLHAQLSAFSLPGLMGCYYCYCHGCCFYHYGNNRERTLNAHCELDTVLSLVWELTHSTLLFQ